MSETEFPITKKQKSVLGVVAILISIGAGLQSYGLLPYQVKELRTELADLQRARRDDRDIIVTLSAQLIAAHADITGLREDMRQFRNEMFNKKN